MQKTIKTLLVIFSVFTALTLVSGRVSAQATLDVCNPPRNVFEKIQQSFDRNIRETSMNHFITIATDAVYTSTVGLEMSETMGCINYVSNQIEDPALRQALQDAGCPETSGTICQSFLNQHTIGGAPTDEGYQYDRIKFANGKVAGSLLGMGYYLQNSMNYEPVPVNTAYFFKDYAYRLPVVGSKVMAADNEVNYRNTFIDTVLGIWKITRNAAYAIMAIVMLYVGITIILRKQVNQKVVVTVQYSLPKIALALVLIAFSYPIGALIASLSWALFFNAGAIITTLATSAGGSTELMALEAVIDSMGGVLLFVMLGLLSYPGIGLGMVVAVVLLVCVMVVLYLIAYFKALWLFIRLLIGICTAPITFAISAIPGNEDKMFEWFKQMASWGLGMFGIAATIKLIHMFGATVIADMVTDNPFPGTLFAMFGSVFIFILGYTYAYKVPQFIETAIMGPKKR